MQLPVTALCLPNDIIDIVLSISSAYPDALLKRNEIAKKMLID